MRKHGADWREYLVAARRKIAIASYHLSSLEREARSLPPTPEEVPLALQAHFEGILYACVAAEDQAAEAANRGFRLDLNNRQLQKAFGKVPDPEARQQLRDWQKSPLAVDVRDIRVRATHHHYVKVLGGRRLEVQLPVRHDPYAGSRELVAYSRAVVDHLRTLNSAIDALERAIGGAEDP